MYNGFNLNKQGDIRIKYLYSDLNKDGIFLEELLEGIVHDLNEKTSLISGDTCLASRNYRTANALMCDLLRHAAEIQANALNYAKSLQSESTFNLHKQED